LKGGFYRNILRQNKSIATLIATLESKRVT